MNGAREPSPGPLDDRAARLSATMFSEEQARLGRIWTCLGFAHQVKNSDDWFRAELGGRSIVVQRFEAGLRGFENRCAHRGYPLRLEKSGHGPLVCGFHHWRYNADGLALGVPQCQDMFGKTPRELDARLEPVEIAICGNFVFGRFAGGDTQTLEDWLGPAHAILAFLTRESAVSTTRLERVIHANWRYLVDISLDDYHIVAVHPTTFGKGGYLPSGMIHYSRFGAHSAYLPGGNAETLRALARECAAGTYAPDRYRIFQIFPNLVVAVVRAVTLFGDQYWFLVIQHMIPQAYDRTQVNTMIRPIPQQGPAGFVRATMRTLSWPSTTLGFRHFAKQVNDEDFSVCEHLQSAARSGDAQPRLARQEERIGWFSDSYSRLLSGETLAGDDVSTN